MLSDQIIKNIGVLREKYSFEKDKMDTFLWEKKVREMAARLDLKNLDGIKDLLSEIEIMIKEISLVLAWDEDINKADKQEERNKLVIRREVYLWLYSFFKDPQKVIEGISKTVEAELENK